MHQKLCISVLCKVHQKHKLNLITVFGASILAIMVCVVEDLNELLRKTAIVMLLSLTYRRAQLNILGMSSQQWWYKTMSIWTIFTFVIWLQIDAQWRFFLTIFSLSYISSWFIFAICWNLISFTHGDLNKNLTELSEFRSCVVGCDSFACFFLFSLETQVLRPTENINFFSWCLTLVVGLNRIWYQICNWGMSGSSFSYNSSSNCRNLY